MAALLSVSASDSKDFAEDQSAAPHSGVDGVVALSEKEMVAVNALISERIGSDVTMIPELADHLISSGGKRLRPVLTIIAAQMCGYEGKDHIKLAASVEFMHTATLLHDDVVDESDLRRGKKTARLIWGNQSSVLVGDFLLGQAFRMMVETGSLDCLDILSHASTVISEGEVMQLLIAKKMETDEQAYMSVIKAKTAALFAAAAEVGPALALRSDHDRRQLNDYGMNLGIAFQLVDDLLDYSGDMAKLGKSVGDDFREGKITLPIVLAFRHADADEKRFWERTIEQGNILEGDLEQAIALLEKHGALEETRQRALAYGELSKQAIASFPQSVQRDALIDLVDFAIDRVN